MSHTEVCIICIFRLQILVLPVLTQLSVYESAPPEDQQTMRDCYVAAQNVDLYTETALNCSAWGYAIMTELYQGAKGECPKTIMLLTRNLLAVLQYAN